MNKKILILTVTLLSILMLLVPIIGACRPGNNYFRGRRGIEKVPITLKFIAVAAQGASTPYLGLSVLQNNVNHVLNRVKYYPLELTIDGGPIITGEAVAISNYYWWTTENGAIIPFEDRTEDSRGNGIYREYNVLTFNDDTGAVMDGTFEGVSDLKISDYQYTIPPIFNIDNSGTFVGTGVFEGQKIVACYEGPNGGTWTGYLYRPRN